MFYSHEVLTSRKYGVATVWLVATLGSKSNLKKVSRKAILDVDVQKACDTIVAPAAPMALRLQSNLLYGVARVYSQQCGYMLHDAEAAKQSMSLLLKTMHVNTLDATGENNGRSDQLVLQDDPEFLPDFTLLAQDLDRMDVDFGRLEESQHSILSPHHSQRTSVGSGSIQDIGGLIIPPSASSYGTGPVGGPTGFSVRGDSSAGVRTNIGGLDDDLGLVIDEDGNLHVREGEEHNTPLPLQGDQRSGVGSVRSRTMGRGAGEKIGGGHVAPADGDGFMPLQDDGYIPAPDVDALPTNVDGQSQEVQQETSEETAEAPARRRARPALKIVAIDNNTVLHNQDLARWGNEYVTRMQDLIHKKSTTEIAAQAKKNAEFWMLGQSDRGPLSIFTGIRLLEALIGHNLHTNGQKRPRDDANDIPEERRVRPRSEPSSQEAGRGALDDGYAPVMDDGYMPMVEDDTIEQGREAPTPLPERGNSSIMPWNQSIGSHRETALFSAGGGGFPTSNSLGGGSQAFATLAHRRSRLTSASPLLGRGTALPADIESLQLHPDDAHMSSPIGSGNGEEFERFGAAAKVSTQLADESQWQRTALDGESVHFLDFVQNGIAELDAARAHEILPGDEDDETVVGSIEFAALLPTEMHSRIVAAQGLLHVLALGTKDLLVVRQEEAFGAIVLRVREAVS